MAQEPRGFRNNNPGNLRHSASAWQGLADSQTDPDFVQFTTPAFGVRALVKNLETYQDRHGLKTLRGIINRWAPPVENNTNAYLASVSDAVGVGPDEPIDIRDPQIASSLVAAIARHENGKDLDPEVLAEGLQLAGLEPPEDDPEVIQPLSDVGRPVTREDFIAGGFNVDLARSGNRPTQTQATAARQLKDFTTQEQQVAAAFNLENITVSTANEIEFQQSKGVPAPGYNPMDHLLPGEELYATEFLGVRSAGEQALVRQRIAQENKWRRQLAEGPLNEFLAIGLAVLGDPLTYVPLAGQFGRGLRGASALRRVGVFSATAAVETAAAEAALQATQRTRTVEESLGAIIVGGTLGAGLGGVGAAIAARRAARDIQAVADQVLGEAGDQAARARSIAGSGRLASDDAGNPGFFENLEEAQRFADEVSRAAGQEGSARVVPVEREGRQGFAVLEEADEATVKAFEDTVPTISRALDEVEDPILDAEARAEMDALGDNLEDLENSALPEPQSAGSAAVADPTRVAENTKLVGAFKVEKILASLKKIHLAAPSLELMTSPIASARAAALKLVDIGMITKGHMKGVAFKAPVEGRIRGQTNALVDVLNKSLKQLYNETRQAGNSLSRLQFHEEIAKAMRRKDRHANPQVQAAAQALRKNVVDMLKVRAQAAKLLGEDIAVTTSPTYFTRVWSHDKINSNRAGLRDIIERDLRSKISIDELADEAEYRDIADTIIDNILGNPGERVPFLKVAGKRGPLKERVYDIRDELVEEFLENDVEIVLSRYIRTMASDIEMTEMFGRPDPNDILRKSILEEANKIADQLPVGAARAKLMKQAEREANLVSDMSDYIRGLRGVSDSRYRGLVSVAKTIRGFNFMRTLGMVLLSSIPDVGRVVAINGLSKAFGSLFVDAANGFKGIRLAKRDTQMLGTALDVSQATRVRAIADLGEQYADETRIERGVDRATRVFSLLTLLNHWNTALKSWASMVTSTMMLSSIEKMAKGQKLTKREQRKLAENFIDEGLAIRIAGQAEHFERLPGGVVIANIADWTDQEAVAAFRDGLLREVDNAIITPGVGDAPLWTSSEIGKTIFQFKRFGMASTQRILISGLQARDMAALNSFMVMVAMGGFGTYLRDLALYGEVRERTPEQWARDFLDRSGAFSMFFEADSFIGKVIPQASLSNLLTGAEPSRFAARNVFGQLGGPAVGALADLVTFSNAISDGTFTQGDLHKARRFLPGQNLPYLALPLNEVEKAVAKQFRLPKSNAGRPSTGRRNLPTQ